VPLTAVKALATATFEMDNHNVHRTSITRSNTGFTLHWWWCKVSQIRQQTKVVHVYFNNHYGGKAVVNAMQFKEMNGIALSVDERKVLENAQTYLVN